VSTESIGRELNPVIVLLRRIVWWYFLIPIVVGGLIAYGTMNDFKGWSDHHVLKGSLEIIHPAFLVCFFVAAFQGYRFSENPAFSWMCWLSVALLGREIHFSLSDQLIWVALAILAYIAWNRREALRDLFQTGKPLTLFLVAISCYVASQGMDYLAEHGYSHWKLAWESNTEEALETLGGFMLMLVPLSVKDTSVKNSRAGK
jgi:hypothetical protein